MVCYELPFLCKPCGIYAVWFEDYDYKIRHKRHYHKRSEKKIAACEFGNEEHACERSVHYGTHDARHAEKSVILFGNIDSEVVHVPKSGEHEAAYTAQKQTGRENTAASAATIGSLRCNNLTQNDKSEV